MLSVFPRDAIFTPADLSAWGDIWPTGAQIVSSGRRLVLVSGTDYGDAMAPLIFAKGARVCGWSEPWLGGIRGAPDCVLQSWRGPRQLYDGSLVRVFSCELQYGPLNCDFVWHGSNAPMLDEASLPGVDACGVNIPSPDLLTPSRAAAAVWSWAPGHPFEADVGEGTGAAAACGIIGADDGRWRASECSGQSLPSACRAAGKSLLSDEQWVLGQGERGECPEGSSFDLPKHPRENYWLAEVLKEAGAPAAWLPLQGPDWTLDAAFAAAGEHEQLMRVLDRSDEDVVLLQS